MLQVPGSGRRRAITSSSTSSTDADDKFPVRRRVSQLAAIAASGIPQRFFGRPQNLRPAGVQPPSSQYHCASIHARPETSPCPPPRCCRITSGTSGESTNAESALGDLPAHHLFRVRIKRAPRVDDRRPVALDVVSRHHHRARAIREQRRRNLVRDRRDRRVAASASTAPPTAAPRADPETPAHNPPPEQCPPRRPRTPARKSGCASCAAEASFC